MKFHRFCLGYLLSSLRYFEETRVKQQCQNLLAVSRKLYTHLGMVTSRLNIMINQLLIIFPHIHLGDLPDLLREIMAEVRRLTNAERCSLFLLDPDQQDLVAKVFDGLSTKEVGNVYVNSKNWFHYEWQHIL